MNNTVVGFVRPALAGIAAALLAGCAATDTAMENRAAPAAPAVTASSLPAPYSALQKGFTTAQIRERIGAPAETKPFKSAGVTAQVWSYVLHSTEKVNDVSVGTRQVPAVNPLTGADTSRTEDVYEHRTVLIKDMLELLVVDDRLIEWKITRRESNAFH
jgi:hypothetical protein